MHDGSLHVYKITCFEITPQLHFGKTQPKIGVHFARLFEVVAAQIENRDAAAGLENAPCFARRRARDGAHGAEPG